MVTITIPRHTLKVDQVFVVKLKALSELTVGGGTLEDATSPFDIPVAKMPWGDSFVPYIPGSTIKGLLRSLYEEEIRQRTNGKTALEVFEKARKDGKDHYALKELGEKALGKLLKQFIEVNEGDIADLYLQSENMDEFISAVKREYGVDIGPILNNIKLSEEVCNPVVEGLACELPIRPYKRIYLEALGAREYPCKVCRIFGAPGYASNVILTDMYPQGQLGKDYYILVRRHVAISRVTGAAAEGKLFEIEYVTPGTTFIGLLLVKNKAATNFNEDVVQGLGLDRGRLVTLGRRKTAGMGQAELTVETVKSRTQLENLLPPQLLVIAKNLPENLPSLGQ